MANQRIPEEQAVRLPVLRHWRGGGMLTLAAAMLLLTVLPSRRLASSPPPPVVQPASTAPDDGDLTEPEYPVRGGEPRPAGFTSDEWAAVMAVVDGTSGCDEEAYYVLLKKAENEPIPPPGDRKLVTFDNLMAHPNEYAGRVVQIELLFFDVNRNRTDRPHRKDEVWEIRALWPTGQEEKPAVVLVCPRSEYKKPGRYRKIQAIGYFYKVRKYNAVQGRGTMDVPVIIAQQVVPLAGKSAAPQRGTPWGIFTAVAILLVLYIFVRMKVGRRESVRRRPYAPRRFELTPEEVERSKIDLTAGQPPKAGSAGPQPPAPRPPKGPQP